MSDLTIPPKVADKLGYYVYLYVDPRTDKPFYVGKGLKRRILAHLDETRDSLKLRTIQELQRVGLEPRLEVLTHGLRNEETAFRIESAVIDLLGLGELTNEVRGWKSVQFGRLPLRELVSYYAAEPVVITDPALLIRINKQYRHNMSPQELYEATRGVWRVGKRRENAALAMSVFQGIVKEVFEIASWHPAGTTAYETRDNVNRDGRWEFQGAVAGDAIRARYLDRNQRLLQERCTESGCVRELLRVWLALVHESETLRGIHRFGGPVQAPIAKESGRPCSVIRFRMLQAITASTSCDLG